MKQWTRVAVIALTLLAVVAPAQAGRRDRTPPRVTYATESGAILVSNPGGHHSDEVPMEVFGKAYDRGGIARVKGVFIPCGPTSGPDGCSYVGPDLSVYDGGEASMSCNASHRTCHWRIPGPSAPGQYWFAATAWDRKGNESVGSGILRITVV